jgi:hypothetical protein
MVCKLWAWLRAVQTKIEARMREEGEVEVSQTGRKYASTQVQV